MSQRRMDAEPTIVKADIAEQLRNSLRWKSHECQPIATTTQVSFV